MVDSIKTMANHGCNGLLILMKTNPILMGQHLFYDNAEMVHCGFTLASIMDMVQYHSPTGVKTKNVRYHHTNMCVW